MKVDRCFQGTGQRPDPPFDLHHVVEQTDIDLAPIRPREDHIGRSGLDLGENQVAPRGGLQVGEEPVAF